MQVKSLSKQNRIIIIMTGVIMSLVFVSYFFSKSIVQSDPKPLTENVGSPSEQEQISYGLPVRLKIPGINVDVVIDYVGLNANGEMDVPTNPDNVAWYELGQRPGETGSAVIAGHYGTWKNGKTGVFNNLYTLRKGDKIYIEDEKGETTTFMVSKNQRFDPDADASEVFSSNDGQAHLNLVTCEGNWDAASKSFSQRLVVFTDKE